MSDDRPSWMDRGACNDVDPSVFFDAVLDPHSPDNGFTAALAICSECEVRVTCLQYALDENEKHGVWGKTTPRERVGMRRRRRSA